MPAENFIQELFVNNSNVFQNFRDKAKAQQFIDSFYNFLFASYAGKYEDEKKLAAQYSVFQKIFAELLAESLKDEEQVKQQTAVFFNELPLIHKALVEDAAAVLEFDPAAKSLEEVLLAYPGFYAIAVYRIAHQVHVQDVELLPRIFAEYAHSRTGIDIHPGAKIGRSFFIDHGTGIVIGETTVIGNDVKIYQGVTLGALNVSKAYASIKRHPTINDNVVIYSGATILGGDTVIGSNSIIGGNVWLTYSVPEHSVVYHQSEIKIRDNNPFPEPLNFVI